jgi:hypothetical protein
MQLNKRVMAQINQIPIINKILLWDSILSKNEIALELYEAAEPLVNSTQRLVKLMCEEPRMMLILKSDSTELAATYLKLNKGVKLSNKSKLPPIFQPFADHGYLLVYTEGINPELSNIFQKDTICFDEILNRHGIEHMWAGLFSQREYQLVPVASHLYQW